MKHIVLAGGSGFLGDCIVDHFKHEARITVLTRGRARIGKHIKYVHWDGRTPGAWMSCLEDADVLINLSGKSVDCRYTAANKKDIYASRLESTAILGKAIQQCKNPPTLWINSSSATIYRHALDRSMDEETGELGTGFSVDVCRQWEKTWEGIETPSTRKVVIRTAIVLGKNGGALVPLRTLAKLRLGGRQGSGRQYFSWIHVQDFLRIIAFLLEHTELEGVINVSSPTPVSNEHLMTSLRNALHVSFGAPLPRWLLEVGALLIRTETELVLKSRRVVPKRLLDAGFRFQYDNIGKALGNLKEA